MLISPCSHGMPTPMSCVECMQDGPVAQPSPGPTERLLAIRWATAKFDQRCARRYSHDIRPGDQIGYVDELGWCCDECAR